MDDAGLSTILTAGIDAIDGTDTVGRALQAVRSHLGMDVAFVSEFADGRRFFRYVDPGPEKAPIQVGDSSPLEEGYCQRIVDGRLPQLMPDTSAVPAAMELPVTRRLPVGAHISVPLQLRDGRVYGTFCCFSFAPDPSLTERDLRMMRAFAEITAHYLEKDLEWARRRQQIRERVGRAIEEDRLTIVYQPIYRLADDWLAGLECLTRFPGPPHHGPDIWFAEAAEAGMGVELELAAIRKALCPLPSFGEKTFLGVNVSPDTVLSGELETVLRNVAVERVVLEITEHAHDFDYGALLEALRPLRSRGARLAIDDAGAGYASLRHILELRPDLIKLDMSLTRNIDCDTARRALASALIGFARETGSRIVAEGVESQAELDVLRSLGVEKAQGYLLGRPMPLAGAIALLGPAKFH